MRLDQVTVAASSAASGHTTAVGVVSANGATASDRAQSTSARARAVLVTITYTVRQ